NRLKGATTSGREVGTLGGQGGYEAGAVAEAVLLDAHAVHEGEPEIADGGVVGEDDVAAGVDGAAAFAEEEGGDIDVGVGVAVGHAGAIDDHGVVEEGAFALLHFGNLVDEVGHFAGVVFVYFAVFFDEVGFID